MRWTWDPTGGNFKVITFYSLLFLAGLVSVIVGCFYLGSAAGWLALGFALILLSFLGYLGQREKKNAS